VESNLVQYKELEFKLILQARVLEIVRTRKFRKVRDILVIARQWDPSLTVEQVKEAFESLQDDGKLSLEPALQGSFLSHITKNLDFIALPLWLSLSAIALTVIVAYVLPTINDLLYLRIVSGAATVLFIPGYGLIALLFPRRDLTKMERIMLSILISLALVPVLWLSLSNSPLGAGLDSTVLAMSVTGALLVLFGAYRQFLARKKTIAVN